MKPFDYSLDYASLDLRAHPELYAVGRGEQGVLMVEPYKSEILPHWRFKTPEEAAASSEKIYEMFLAYKAAYDFVGMDMARKFLQMGFTRARRYANHKSGRKYAADGGAELPDRYDAVKAASAAIFKKKWDEARTDPDYLAMKKRHRERYERDGPS
ncbi:DUF4385 domain-containing protein [Cohnella ginsengisoli]|uniref:DUF4385 domain-containing protein n=1 Tax=Cohnella ginsengisoli TaxID=425004 RepID=A0A9X4KHI1_9BACL|nr:DUF4385 domain-containing protein [Cohnella ginsengisoli]MDG0792085.1 DUF4385 domain-containing protein [Cohnella ginsengisoli]